MILAATLTGAAVGTVIMLSAGGPAAASPGVDVPTTYVDTLPHCATEDAAGPCKWFADVDGNGAGRSFWVDSRGAVHAFYNGHR